MSEDNTNPAGSMEGMPTRLELLKRKADLMGVTYSNNIGEDTLADRIQKHLDGESTKGTAGDTPNPFLDQAKDIQTAQEGNAEPVRVMSPREYLLKDSMKLVRCMITNLDPKKKDLPGEIITVANEYIGTVRRFVPYGEITDDGWHIPNVIYEHLKGKKFLHSQTKKIPKTGIDDVTTRDAPEFAIQVLPPLTEEELERLRTAQLAAGSVE